MKKLLLFFSIAVATFSASAITVEEAFDKIAAIPGIAVSDMPLERVPGQEIKSGKLAMLLGQPGDVINAISAEITDAETSELEIQGQKTKIYIQPAEGDLSNILSVTVTPQGSICIFMTGNAEGAMEMLKN